MAIFLNQGFIQTIDVDSDNLLLCNTYVTHTQNLINVQKTEIANLQANLTNKTEEISALQSLINNQSEEISALKNLINTKGAGNLSVSSSNSSMVVCQVVK